MDMVFVVCLPWLLGGSDEKVIIIEKFFLMQSHLQGKRPDSWNVALPSARSGFEFSFCNAAVTQPHAPNVSVRTDFLVVLLRCRF